MLVSYPNSDVNLRKPMFDGLIGSIKKQVAQGVFDYPAIAIQDFFGRAVPIGIDERRQITLPKSFDDLNDIPVLLLSAQEQPMIGYRQLVERVLENPPQKNAAARPIYNTQADMTGNDAVVPQIYFLDATPSSIRLRSLPVGLVVKDGLGVEHGAVVAAHEIDHLSRIPTTITEIPLDERNVRDITLESLTKANAMLLAEYFIPG